LVHSFSMNRRIATATSPTIVECVGRAPAFQWQFAETSLTSLWGGMDPKGT